MSKIVAIIPARYNSTRFPGKVLEKIGDKTILNLVWNQVSKVSIIDEIIIATDDQRVIDEANSFGAEAELTFSDHKSGTDRCAQVADKFWDDDIIINIQGDEPYIDPAIIEELAQKMINDDWISIGTLCTYVKNIDESNNPNVVKLVKDNNDKALYFSRFSIPYQRDDSSFNKNQLKHIGIYAFRNKTLQNITKLPESYLESTEKLEQLRWMENGYSIFAFTVDYEGFGIDTPEDLEKAKR
ncbi:MAG: 3-deoxy-manno-octulosonate cytidylyltransferase [Saprospiraceae bacterium]